MDFKKINRGYFTIYPIKKDRIMDSALLKRKITFVPCTAFCDELAQEQDACDPHVFGFHTCLLMRNAGHSQMYDKGALSISGNQFFLIEECKGI